MSTARQRLMMKTVQNKLKDQAKQASEGDWESLIYTYINAEKMRKFLQLINETGNSFPCSQDSVTFIEMTLKLHKTFKNWSDDPNNQTAKRDGYSRGFVYLFTSK